MLDLCWTPPPPLQPSSPHTATEALLIGIRAFEFELRFIQDGPIIDPGMALLLIPGWPYYSDNPPGALCRNPFSDGPEIMFLMTSEAHSVRKMISEKF